MKNYRLTGNARYADRARTNWQKWSNWNPSLDGRDKRDGEMLDKRFHPHPTSPIEGEEKSKGASVLETGKMVLRCQNDYPVCSFKYNPENGEPESGITPGTSLDDIPNDWICPRCRVTGVKTDDTERPYETMNHLVASSG